MLDSRWGCAIAACPALARACLTLPAGGPFILPLAQEYGSKILPADSEHSAIFQVRRWGAGRAVGVS